MKTLKTDLSILKEFVEYAPVGVKFLYLRPEGVDRLNRRCLLPDGPGSTRADPFYFRRRTRIASVR